MIDDSFSLAMAEVAATYAGFATIAVVVGRVSGRTDLHLETRATHGVVVSSIFLTLFCLLPHAFSRVGASDPWRLAAAVSCIVGVILAALAIHDIRAFAKAEPALIRKESGYMAVALILIVLGILSFGAAATGVTRFSDSEGFALGLFFYFLNSSHMLVRAVRAFLFG